MSESMIGPFKRVWDHIWFQDRTNIQLEVVRIGVATALFLYYFQASFFLFQLWGPDGWFPVAAFSQLRKTDVELFSILAYFKQPWHYVVFHGVLLFCCAALAIGWRTSWIKWLVLIGHVTYAQRNPTITYGVHAISASLLFLLCLAPVGRAMSLDRIREVQAFKRNNMDGRPPLRTSRWGFACRRLMQIQMAALFFFSAVHKIRADDWWNGEAIWQVFLVTDYYNPIMLDIVASQFWLINVATYGVVILELAYPFLVWQKLTRAYMLVGAVFIHFLFFTFLSLHFFSSVMFFGHMSFLREEWLKRLALWWKQRVGGLEMIYDGNCGFCKRSMHWFLAFDGLEQIKTRNFRTDPSPIVSDDEMEKALHLVLEDGRKLPGFEAYRYVVPRVPGLWWMVPFFYIPVLSRLVGVPLYNWIASNRNRVSNVLFKEAT